MLTREHFFDRKKRETGVALNDAQKRAVLHTDGALLLLASPGSGKTTTLMMRIGYLIEEKGVKPERIKAVTFSRAAAADMQERFKRFFPGVPPVHFSTIHSLAFEVMREHLRRSGTAYQLIEGEVNLEEQGGFDPERPPLHKKFILRRLFQEIAGENITDDQMEELTTYISFVKNKMLPQHEWAGVPCDVPLAEAVMRQYETFKQSGADKLLIDYDDMLTLGNQALEENSWLLRKYQQRYDYVLTDESQDTSLVQHAIIEKLVRKHGNLCVVADDDQSIYTWRAAEPEYLLHFRSVYPNAATLMMEQNYRSSKDIVDVANRFIKRNKNRYDKNMFTHNPRQKPIVLRSFADYKYQSKYVAEKVAELADLREAAVLYRNNASSIMLMNEFDRAGIPFYMKDTDNRFFSHWVVEDVLNFMRMSFSDRRPDLLEKIHTKCIGYITKKQMAALMGIADGQVSVFDTLLDRVPLQDYQVKQLKEAKETFQQMRGVAPLHAIRMIRGLLGYEKAIDKMCERLGFRREALIGILNTLEAIADTLETMEEFAARLKHLESALKTSKFNKHENAVTLSTLHSAKGLEFDQVFMVDLVDGILPAADDIQKFAKGSKAQMEESARLFYVGMTRARTHLELLTYRARDGEKAAESQFVADVRLLLQPGKPAPVKKELPRALTVTVKMAAPAPVNPRAIRGRDRLQAGGAVKHGVFGNGEIVSLGSETILIRFQAGEKRLSVAACLERGLLEPG